MLHKLIQLQHKAERFNEERIRYALESMSDKASKVYQLIPLLFHYNLPSLPGYVSDKSPSGIDLFTPNDDQLALMSDIFGLTPPDELIRVKSKILGVYSMGSTSSLGQSYDSDIDVWLCHQNDLSQSAQNRLNAKCALVTIWAESYGVELNFFLVAENHFQIEKTIQITNDNAGSALHMLLLDEFYRTAVHLAGRPLLWPVYPIEYEDNYEQHVQQAIEDKQLDPNQWLDLGGFSRIPAEEYFGAALWQLYKGIDSPYKAVLKSISMEAYSAQYPDTELLCIMSKKLFQESKKFTYHLDPYYLMLKQATAYLKSTNDTARLDLLRRCFYLKNCDRLKLNSQGEHSSWQHKVMYMLLERWEWDKQKVERLNQRPFWKVSDVKVAYKELLDALMLGYKNLIQFARNSHISESINPEDIGVLSRKLYAAFENLPGKVTLINPQISADLQEPNISFIQVPQGRKNASGWYLYKFPLTAKSLIGRSYIEHSDYLSKLMAWSYFNGLLTFDTQLHLYNQSSDLMESTLHQFASDLASTFAVKVPSASNQALSGPCEISQLGIFINLESDPTNHWGGQVIEFDANASDVFSFGANHECLVGSIDLIYRNSWNEIRTLNFKGPKAVIDALTTLLSKMHRNSKGPESVDIFCYSQHFRSLIRSRYQQLVNESLEHRLHHEQKHAVKTLLIGQIKYGIFFESRGVSVKKLEKGIDFYSQISDNKLNSLPLRLDKNSLKTVPAIVDSYASEGLVQFFFESPKQRKDENINIYIVDENNRVETYQHFSGNKDELVQGVNRFYTSNKNKFNPMSNHPNFNLPQFYEIQEINGELRALPYRTQVKRNNCPI